MITIAKHLLDSNTCSPEEILAETHIFCDYCGEEIELFNPRITQSKNYPYPISFLADAEVEIIPGRPARYAHQGACYYKASRRASTIVFLEENNELIDDIEAISSGGEIFYCLPILWEDSTKIDRSFMIWTKQNVYYHFHDGEYSQWICSPRNPMVLGCK
jgi:hypothetical protein